MNYYEKIILVLLICESSPAFSQFMEDGWSACWNNCYKVFSTDENGITWFDAQKACERLGSNLVSIHDMNEQMHVAALINSTSFVSNIYGIWIGLNRSVLHSPILRWTDGTPYDFKYWSFGNPNDAHGNIDDGEPCVHIWDSCLSPDDRFLWNDIACASYVPLSDESVVVMGGYVCKKRKLPAYSIV